MNLATISEKRKEVALKRRPRTYAPKSTLGPTLPPPLKKNFSKFSPKIQTLPIEIAKGTISATQVNSEQ